MYFLFFVISFSASVIGAVCGIGGGVIIKPVLDAAGLMEVGAVSFLSGCTVLSMSFVSVVRSLGTRDKVIEWRCGTALAAGAAIGGAGGKEVFQYAYSHFADSSQVGAVQSGVLLLVTALTFIYTLNKHRVRTYHIRSLFLCAVTGLALGLMSAFLGIGGGPINLMVLSFCFSMTTKQAAANSLYIILFSQFTSLIHTLATNTVPEFPVSILGFMIMGGVLGALAGGRINERILDRHVNKLFMVLMAVIMGINIYNIHMFL
ncbi:hypothetical protein EDD76_101198 [Kineothrix alysoides]|uniref:Probable membrane transporter protein n=1 Tax=Kineothrix alysoides TaxID=1469948 RepID=A0A4R1R6B2_9FIRM|nr:sulfite exporter TauE/SafE family protein [Kineothrix alysoides]TCL61101.1 hypothetical protein EDD76_101198 [Kineothrix alysoides]